MVGRRELGLGTQELVELVPELSDELCAAVRGDISGRTKPGNPVAQERVRAGLGGGICQRDGFRPLGEAVDDGEEVPVAPGFRQRSDQINVQAVEAFLRRLAGGQRRAGVAGDLGRLAVVAVLAPLGDVLLHGMLHEPGGHGSLGCSAADVGQPVNHVEDLSPEGGRDDGASFASAHVAEHCVVGSRELDISQVHVCDGGAVSLDISRGFLLAGQVFIVELRETGRKGSRERVGDDVVLSRDVLDVGGELADEAEVPGLPGRFVRSAGDSRRETFGVGENRERTTLQEVAEMTDGQVDAQQLAVEPGVLVSAGCRRREKKATGRQRPSASRWANSAPTATSEASVVMLVGARGCG